MATSPQKGRQPELLQVGLFLLAFHYLGASVGEAAPTTNTKPKISLHMSPSEEPGVIDAREDTPVNSFLAMVQAEDPDSGPAGQVECTTKNEYVGLELLYPISYKIALIKVLDRESDPIVNVNITCRDHGRPPYVVAVTFRVSVKDMNDNAPVFSTQGLNAQVMENSPAQTFVTQVTATDADSDMNGRVSYSLKGWDGPTKPFVIDEETGKIYTHDNLDRDAVSDYHITVIATDSGQPALSGSATVTVKVEDANDNAPVISTTMFWARENEKAMMPIGRLQGEDLDEGKNAELVFGKVEDSDSSSTAPFLILPGGDVLSVVTLDREQREEYQLVAYVKDKGSPSLSSTATILIKVEDVNDNTPIITSPCLDTDDLEFIMDNDNNASSLMNSSGFIAIDWYSPDDARVVYKVMASDNDALDNAKLSFSIQSSVSGYHSDTNTTTDAVNNINSGQQDDPLFKIDASTGEIRLRRIVRSREDLVQLVHISVTDNGQPPLSAYCVLHVIVDVDLAEVTTPIVSNNRGNLGGNPTNGATNSNRQIYQIYPFSGRLSFVTFFVILHSFIKCRWS